MSLVNCADRRKQFAAQHVFVKIGLRAQAQRPPHAIVIVQGRDDNEPGLGKFRAESADDLFTTNDRQIPVHQRHVGLEPPEPLDRLLAVTGLAHDGHVRLGIHHGSNSLTHLGMIVNNENPYLLCLRWHS